MTTPQQQLDAWIDAHFDEEVQFLQELIRVPTDTPPGNNAPHAERTAELLQAMGLDAEKHAVPEAEVKAAGLETITNLIVRRRYGEAARPSRSTPMATWCRPAKAGRTTPTAARSRTARSTAAPRAVSKCDIANFTFAIRALESLGKPLKGSVELHVDLRRGIRRRSRARTGCSRRA